jgi:hypothetical protein
MSDSAGRIRWGRALAAGLAGAVAFFAGLLLFFGPAQGILTDPELQGAKMLRVFFEIEPLPRPFVHPVMLAGLVTFGLIHALVFAVIQPSLPGRGWRKGLSFGVVLWLLMVLWFEFFMVWNVLGEPLPLVALELALWLGVNLVEGVAIAAVYRPAAA